MSANRAQTASAESLSFEAALDALFDKILEQFRQSDFFSSPDQPVIFPVYAHDNPIVGTSYAWCVIHIIKWLEAAGCRAISDRNPLLPYSAQGDDSAATRNILSNQFCLLPRRVGQRQVANERTHADKALVFCSEVLRQYCIDASAREYVETIEDVYKECQGRPRDHLEQQLQLTVEEKARNGSAWFHHVLTEIALLKLRKNLDCRDHGIIPVALDGELPDYLPFFGPTDLVLKRDGVSLYASDLHKTFFKILLQTYPDQHLAIEKFKDCYMTLKMRWGSDGGTVVRDSFDAVVVKHIRQAFKSLLQQDQIVIRHRLRDRASDKTVGQIQEGPDGDTAEVLFRKHKFLSTLSTVPYGDRKDRNPERDEGTCVWFKNHSKFQEWQESKGASLLWVSADPGCGKSVLAKYLVDDVLLTTDEQMTCYFFFKDDFADQRTLESALRCLLHQFFQHNLSLLDKDLLTRLESNSQLLHSRTDLWKILTDCFQKQPVGRFVLILDGFDECSAEDRLFFMKKLQKLFMDAAAPPIRLLLTSRPYEDIARGLRKLQNKELIIHLKAESEQEMNNISKEIDLVIAKNVNDLGEELDLESDVTELIKYELTKVGNRTYLWVALMMEFLKDAIQTSKSAIKSLIQRLPPTVSAAYEKILSREQDDETNVKTRKLLHIILATKEPLTPGQIAVAFSIPEDTIFNEQSISRDTKFIREFSRLLLVILNDRTYLAHQTVREFLIMKSPQPPEGPLLRPFIQWEHSFHPQHSNRVLAGICMSYLEQCGSNHHLFLHYAAINWIDHLRDSGNADEAMLRQSRNLCDSSSTQFRTWFGIYWRTTIQTWKACPAKLTDLIVASIVGLERTVELLLDTPQDLGAKDSTFQQTAFSWACSEGHFRVAELLLNWVSGSDAIALNSVINTTDISGWTPLHHVVAMLGYEDTDSNKKVVYKTILNLLLDNGADTNAQSKKGRTPLHLAVANCDEAVMKLLLRRGATPDIKDSDGCTALYDAAEVGELALVRSLLEHEVNILKRKVDVNAHFSNDGHTPLLKAIENENSSLDMFRLLLEHTADLDFVDPVFDSDGHQLQLKKPLIFAIECGETEMSELLLERQAVIGLESEEYKKLLVDAACQGNKRIFEIVLGLGGQFNFVFDGQTPLLAALRKQRKEIIEFLLLHGADEHYSPPEDKTSWVRIETTWKLEDYRQTLT